MDIYFKIKICEKGFIAYFAGESFYSSMHFNMLIEVGFLSEAVVTPFFGTDVGSLICMDSQMIKEIVPLFELFLAFVALKNFDLTF